MSKNPRRISPLRRSQIETLESRQVMSADPLGGLLGGGVSHHSIQEDIQHHFAEEAPALSHHGASSIDHHTLPPADFWLDEVDPMTPEEQMQQIETMLSSAHQLTGMDHVKTDYGFDGAGQTVAVIDSGIAYDHYALGDGLGSNYRVVGGWDFTENDADPYDDGPEGSHGTHVAGIVGADDGSRSGVATGVDLVGLRVFNDAGDGYFSWVESALQWVHDNRDSFENPITAINLSLGTNWNSSSTPSWAMLEDEFAQLKADGIFIAVSAGNSFTSYNTPGLSYPAASPHVVPVMSSDDSGGLSYFSQRHSRAIAAPGRFIYSTVPDYAGNNNGQTDDWANFSGTSMASPYVAGGSVIIREAMEFVGYTNITQDTIYDHMVDTADTFYDSSTSASYNRLNMQSAIDALMPEDDFGSSVEDAYQLGTINAGLQTQAGPMSGHIAALADSDYFTFTAGSTGTVTFDVTNATHAMDAMWQGMGGEGWASEDGDSYTMNVVAGQEYSIALSSGDGLGYYDLSFSAESTFSYTDWGATAIQETKTGLTAGAETYYRIAAGQAGYVTAQAIYSSGSANLALLNSDLEVVATGSSDRLDYIATQGEELYLRVDGAASNLDIRLTNAVSQSGSTVMVAGTSGNDSINFVAGTMSTVGINGVSYSLAGASIFVIDGGAGANSVDATGSAADDVAVLRVGSFSLTSSAYDVFGTNFNTIDVHGGGGANAATFYDSVASDSFSAKQSFSRMTGGGQMNSAWGFATIAAYGNNGGTDVAEAFDSAGDDRFLGKTGASILYGDDFEHDLRGFEYVYAYSLAGGADTAELWDSPDDDLLIAREGYTTLRNAYSTNFALSFDMVYAYSTAGGSDAAFMYGSSGLDIFVGRPEFSVYRGDTFFNYASGFSQVSAFSDGASGDYAFLYGGVGNDSVYVSSGRTELYGDGYSLTSMGFTHSRTFGMGGQDTARVVSLDDGMAFYGADDLASVSRPGQNDLLYDFDRVIADVVDGASPSITIDDVDYVFEQV